jgi:hypothetical protein
VGGVPKLELGNDEKTFFINLECDNLLSLSSPGIKSRHKQSGDESPHSILGFFPGVSYPFLHCHKVQVL